jgi:hypothetical protein
MTSEHDAKANGEARAKSSPRPLVFTPKGWEPLAQGNALGSRPYPSSRLKAWDGWRVAGLQPAGWSRSRTQGGAALALG